MRHLRPALLLYVLSVAVAWAEAAPVNTGYFNGLAANGYDVMTYWHGGDPKKRDPAISAQYNGATWVFTSPGHRDEFLSDPAWFAPQYGGYCASAAPENSVADVDPFAWRIWNGKLYLNDSLRVRRIRTSDNDEIISKADGSWPTLLQND